MSDLPESLRRAHRAATSRVQSGPQNAIRATSPASPYARDRVEAPSNRPAARTPTLRSAGRVAAPVATEAAQPIPRIAREIGPNGMPVAQSQPYRNSLRGGSSDLREAAEMGAVQRLDDPQGRGFITYRESPDGWQVRQSRVLGEHRGQGVGTQLYSDLIEPIPIAASALTQQQNTTGRPRGRPGFFGGR